MDKRKAATRRMLGNHLTPPPLVEIFQMQIKLRSTKVWWYSLAAIKHRIWSPDNQRSWTSSVHLSLKVAIILEQLVAKDHPEALAWRISFMLYTEEEWAYRIAEMALLIIRACLRVLRVYLLRYSRINTIDKLCKTKTILITWIKLMVTLLSKEEAVVQPIS